MRILLFVLLCVPRLSTAYTMDSVLHPWLEQGRAGLGLLKNAKAVSKAVSVFAPEMLAKGPASPAALHAAGAPLSFTGATPAGYQLRDGVIFPYGQAYLLHYQEGEPESDDHWFRLCRRHDDGQMETLKEFGSCIGELRRLRLAAAGPEFFVAVESACGSGYTIHLLRVDSAESGALDLPTWQGDLKMADLDGDGRLELLHESREEPPAPIGLRLRAAADYGPSVAFRLNTVWRWDGKGWAKAGERWGRDRR